jgi:general secretion pathway protein G
MLTTTPTNRRTRRDAFTLVEVLVVMAIIVILAGIASVGVMRYLDNAKELTAETQMKNIATAYNSYFIKTGSESYPNSLQELIQPTDGGRAYLEGGIQAITSPWGEQYTVQIVDTSAGPKPVVFCNTPNGTIQFPKAGALQ